MTQKRNQESAEVLLARRNAPWRQMLSRNLLAARNDRGFTPTYLGHAAGLSGGAAIRNIETGHCGCTVPTLMNLCAALRCTPNELLGYEELRTYYSNPF